VKQLFATAALMAFWALAYFGFWEGVEGARNGAVGFIWLQAFFALFLFSDDVVKACVEESPPDPTALRYLDPVADLAIVITCWWHGYWVTGAALAFAALAGTRITEARRRASAEPVQP
jgi:hypothetical protein